MGWNSQNVTSLLIVNAATGGFSGLFVYSPAAGPGNLIASVAAQSGTDPYGNAYLAGVTSYGASTNSVQLSGGVINFGNSSLISGLIANNHLLLSGVPGTNSVQFGIPVTGSIVAVQPGTTATSETWHAPSLGAGWATGSATAGFQPVRYRATTDAEVEITGVVHTTSATPAATMWTFPSGWFNATTAQRLPVTFNNNAGSILGAFLGVDTSGNVTLTLAPTAINQDVYISTRFPLT